MYHELGQIFKREGHELCVLQCERHRATQDSGLSTYALGMESVYWPELPQNEEVLRSKVMNGFCVPHNLDCAFIIPSLSSYMLKQHANTIFLIIISLYVQLVASAQWLDSGANHKRRQHSIHGHLRHQCVFFSTFMTFRIYNHFPVGNNTWSRSYSP